MSGEPLDPRTFRHVLGQFCTGITIITTLDGDVPIGFACQSFAALSLEPPLVLFCPTKMSRSLAGDRGQWEILRQCADGEATRDMRPVRVEGAG